MILMKFRQVQVSTWVAGPEDPSVLPRSCQLGLTVNCFDALPLFFISTQILLIFGFSSKVQLSILKMRIFLFPLLINSFLILSYFRVYISKLSPSPNPTQLGAELIIFPNIPATDPPNHPTYQKSSFWA